jgi:hypothetical protein
MNLFLLTKHTKETKGFDKTRSDGLQTAGCEQRLAPNETAPLAGFEPDEEEAEQDAQPPSHAGSMTSESDIRISPATP